MLAEKIYTLRRRYGLSQEQLAEKLNVSRQAISKWEGGLSTPELDKLRALSRCFHISMDALTNDQPLPPAGGPEPDEGTTPAQSKVGIVLCLTGAVCLIVLGILGLLRPAAVEQISESSVVTLNGTGILAALFALIMTVGMVLILKKK